MMLGPDPAAHCSLETHRSQSLCSWPAVYSPSLLEIPKLLHLWWDRRNYHRTGSGTLRRKQSLASAGKRGEFQRIIAAEVGGPLPTAISQLYQRNMLPR